MRMPERSYRKSEVTVLMSVYAGTDSGDFQLTLDSLRSQTRPADSLLVVEDGPISATLTEVLDSHPDIRRLRLSRNQGLGPALQAGLEAVDTEFTARLDTDDLAYPHRLETQLAVFAEDPELSVLGSTMREFDDEQFRSGAKLADAAGEIRSLPTTHEEILRYARWNTPVNHPSVMFRTADAIAVGGYRRVHHMEDYDLWARLLASGHRFRNLAEPLTLFRTSNAQFERRTGHGMFTAERQMQQNLVSYGLVSRPRSLFNLLVRSLYRALPQQLLERVYSILFHRKG